MEYLPSQSVEEVDVTGRQVDRSGRIEAFVDDFNGDLLAIGWGRAAGAHSNRLLRHISREARSWIAGHNRRVKAAGAGCRLPSKSPWLNPIEPKWVHGKLGAADLMQRLCAHYRCPLLPPSHKRSPDHALGA